MTTCPHGNVPLSPSAPWPAGGHTPYCRTCWVRAGGGRVKAASPDRLPPRRVRADGTLLLREPNGGHPFNPSVIKYGGRWVMAYRTGWAGSRIAVCEIDPENGIVGPSVPLDLRHPRAAVGAEDPRLFVFRGQLHLSFTAFDGQRPSVLYAPLNGLKVDRVIEPHYAARRAWEKNWAFFEGIDNQLYCVYSIDPVHTVLRVDGDRVAVAGQTDSPVVGWVGGHLRGGAPPVLVDGEWWHWFHGALDDGEPNRRYSVGLYAFDPEPPFKLRRWLTHPVAWASENDFAASGNYCRVAFPGGAVLDRGRWHVAVGVHDRWCEMWSWDHAAVRQLFGLRTTYRTRCEHLGERQEFRPGCSGWSCRHACEAGEPFAVPGGNCQTCPKWAPQS